MKNYKNIVAVILFPVLALGAFFSFSSPKPFDKAKAQKLDRLVDDAMTKHKAPAMLLAVWQN